MQNGDDAAGFPEGSGYKKALRLLFGKPGRVRYRRPFLSVLEEVPGT
jgi:hypothetical protein